MPTKSLKAKQINHNRETTSFGLRNKKERNIVLNSGYKINPLFLIKALKIR